MKIVGDRLNKYNEIYGIVNVIDNCLETGNQITFSLEGKWGKGKSWVLDKVEKVLNGENISTASALPDNKDTHDRNKYFVVKYNAWENDYFDEPLIGILLTLVNALNEQLRIKNFFKSTIKASVSSLLKQLATLAGSISQKTIGINIIDIAKDAVDRVKEASKECGVILQNGITAQSLDKDISMVVDVLNSISSKIPIVFIVDELDRCLPEFAIKNLERLHHIFGKISHSITIVSMYRGQLERSIKKMFGESSETDEYLRKFISFRIDVSSGEIDDDETNSQLDDFAQMLQHSSSELTASPVLKMIVDNSTPRQFEHMVKTAMLCHKICPISTKLFPVECVDAEILLQAIKIARQQEKNNTLAYPDSQKYLTSPLGKAIYDYLKNIRNTLKINTFEREDYIFHFSSSSETILLAVVGIVLNTTDTHRWTPRTNEDQKLFDYLLTYYTKYRINYELIQ